MDILWTKASMLRLFTDKIINDENKIYTKE